MRGGALAGSAERSSFQNLADLPTVWHPQASTTMLAVVCLSMPTAGQTEDPEQTEEPGPVEDGRARTHRAVDPEEPLDSGTSSSCADA